MRKRFSVAGSAAVAVMLALVSAVAAATPSNDTYAGRLTISDVPFSATVDTTDATTGSVDQTLNENCGAPTTDASVWYETTGTGTELLADVSESNYSAGVIVATGSPGSFEVVGCGPVEFFWLAEAGVRYTILVFDDQQDGAGTGGTLRFRVTELPTPEGCTVLGTRFNDVLVGTAHKDVICGLEGDDVLIGLGGNDLLLGGPGNDILEGYGGDDELNGGRGHDLLIGGRGVDALDGGRGEDECRESRGTADRCESPVV